MVEACGTGTPDLWHVALDSDEAPALPPYLEGGTVRLADLLRHPNDRDRGLGIVLLAMLRGGQRSMAPPGETVLNADDQLLLAGRPRDRAALESTMTQPPVAAYVLQGRRVPSSWILRRLTAAQRHE